MQYGPNLSPPTPTSGRGIARRRELNAVVRRIYGDLAPAYDAGTPDAIRHGDRIFPAIPVAAIDGQAGRYDGRTVGGAPKANATGDLAADDLGKSSDNEDCVLWNLAEIADSSATLPTGSPVMVKFVGIDPDTKKVVCVVLGSGGGGSDTCSTGASPTVVNAFSMNEAADGGGGVPNTDGLKVTQVSRVLWSTTDGALYVYYRDYTYNSCGKLVSISGETKVNAVTGVSGICSGT